MKKKGKKPSKFAQYATIEAVQNSYTAAIIRGIEKHEDEALQKKHKVTPEQAAEFLAKYRMQQGRR